MEILKIFFSQIHNLNQWPQNQSNIQRSGHPERGWQQQKAHREKSSQNESVHFWRRFLIMIIVDRYIFRTIIIY